MSFVSIVPIVSVASGVWSAAHMLIAIFTTAIVAWRFVMMMVVTLLLTYRHGEFVIKRKIHYFIQIDLPLTQTSVTIISDPSLNPRLSLLNSRPRLQNNDQTNMNI